MKVIKIAPAGYECNVYAVTEDGKNCILIDCADERALRECRKAGLIPRAVLLTHGHYDHVCGCREAQLAGAEIYCGADEKELIFSEANRQVFGVDIPEFTVNKTVTDGEKLRLCGLDIQVVATPGHTSGSVSYLIGNCLFTGDALFCGSVGRSDFPTGDWRELSRSLKKLYALNGDYTVYAGHGEDTTLDYERKYNPFVRA